jgi:thiosulfate reductase cytochrome b subunit
MSSIAADHSQPAAPATRQDNHPARMGPHRALDQPAIHFLMMSGWQIYNASPLFSF